MTPRFKVYGGNGCRFCRMAVDALEDKGLDFEYINVHEVEEALDFIKGQGFRTVPQIWHGEQYVGGYTELHTYLKEDRS